MRNRLVHGTHTTAESRHKPRNTLEGTMNNEALFLKQQNFLLLLLVVVSLLLLWVSLSPFRCVGGSGSPNLRDSSGCLLSFGSFRGHQYKQGGTVGKPKCLIESKWLRLSQHAVQFPAAYTTGLGCHRKRRTCGRVSASLSTV